MTAYLTIAELKTRTVVPGAFIDSVEAEVPGWVDMSLEQMTHWIDSKLRKRYAAPFTAPYPPMVLAWLAKLVAPEIMLRRGVDPTDRQFEAIAEAAALAKAEITEAADGNGGLYDLPLNTASSATGISRGSPMSYSEASPYVGLTRQRTTGRTEDENGGGSYG